MPAPRLARRAAPGDRLLLEPEHGLLVQSYALRTGDGVVVASEPYDDDPRWVDVPDHHLVDVTDGVVTITDLEA